MAQANLHEDYGIPSSARLAVTSLRQIENETPALAAEMRADDVTIRGLVEGYDAALALGLSREYVARRAFDTTKALREIVQNALDETEAVLGKPDVEVRQDAQGLWIGDRGRGLPVEALLMGATDKACWMRGYYGEGLKLAAGHFVLNGHPVYAFARGKVYKFIFAPKGVDNPRLYAILGRSSRRESGTDILVQGLQVDRELLDRLVSFRSPLLQGKKIAETVTESADCPHAKPSAIYDTPNLLYIRNMYVGESSEVAKRQSLFSYDLWWFRLDVSRTLTTYSNPALFREAAKIFASSPKALQRYAEKLVETGMVSVEKEEQGLALRLAPTFAIFEGHLFIYAVPQGLIPAVLSVLGLQDKENVLGFTSSMAEARDGMRLGYLPFLVSNETGQYLEGVPRLAELMAGGAPAQA